MSIGPDGELEAWPGAGMQMYTYLNPEEQVVWDKIDDFEKSDRLFMWSYYNVTWLLRRVQHIST